MTEITRIPVKLPLCGKGTFNGPAAEAAPFGFAPCVLDMDHPKGCHSGDAPREAA